MDGEVSKGKLGPVGRLAKGRSGSVGTIEELLKRKRETEGLGKGGKGEEEEVLHQTKKAQRSPIGKGAKGGEGGLEGMMRGMMEETRFIWSRVEESLGEIRRELEEMKRREGEWKLEKERLMERMDMLEKKLERREGDRDTEGIGKLEKRVGKLEEEGEVRRERKEDRKIGLVVERMEEMERKMERREKEERRRNVVVKGLRVEDGKVKEGIEKVLGEIGGRVRIEEVRQIKTGKEDWGEMVIVRLGSEEEKRRVMKGKKKLKGGKIWIMEDLTWKERRTKWRLRELARAEEGKGNRVWIGSEKISINGQWWFWDEKGEKLVDVRGREKGLEVGGDGRGEVGEGAEDGEEMRK